MNLQSDGPSNNAWGVDLCDPVMVSHQSRLILLARERSRPTGTLYFQVLDPSEAAQGDDFSAWNGWYRYRFPETIVATYPQNAGEAADAPDRELRLAGMDLLTVTPDAQLVSSADAAFRVVSDGTYLSVFRASIGGTLLLNRLALIASKAEVDSEQVERYLLEPAWEVRFRRSRLRDVPRDEMDNQSYVDPVGEPFYEPAHEFARLSAIVGSGYVVARAPTANPEVSVLYVGITTSAGVQLHQVRQSGSTITDFTETPLVYPPLIPTLRTGGAALAPIPGLAPALTYYAEQENSSTNDDEGAELQRAGHLMLAIPVAGGGLAKALAIYDFALDRNGNIANLTAGAQSLVLVDGSIVSGSFVPDTTSLAFPTAAAMASTVQMVDGLLVSSMVLGQVQPHTTPNLHTGDDGLVHAYFGGPLPVPPFDRFSSLDPDLPQAMVAQFDARANRLILSVPWLSPVPQEQPNGSVDFVALQSGSSMEGSTLAVTDGNLGKGGAAAPDLCTVTITYPPGTSLPVETWQGVPRDLEIFMDVLNGKASDDSADPEVLSGARPFFDFEGTLYQARIPLSFPAGVVAGPPPAVTFVSTMPDISLSTVTVATSGKLQNYTLAFTAPGGKAITIHWQSVPTILATLRDVFDGAAGASTYAYPADPTSTPLFGLNTDAPGVDAPVLLFSTGANPNAAGLSIQVLANAADATARDVIITSNGVPTTIPGVPAEVDGFVAALQANAAFSGLGLGITGMTAGGNVRVTLAPVARMDLAATSVIFDVLLPNADLGAATLPDKTYAAGRQSHVFTPMSTLDITRMAGFLARSLQPSAGATAFVQNVSIKNVRRRVSRSLHPVAGVDSLVSGVWIRTDPQAQCAFAVGDAVTIPVVTNGSVIPESANLRPQWDWTLEAWVRPQAGVPQRIITFADTATAVPTGNPALAYAVGVEGQQVVTAGSYAKQPGALDSSYFQTGTSIAADFMPAGEFTWEVWVQPDDQAGPAGSGAAPPLGGIIQVGQAGRTACFTVGLTADRHVQIVALDNLSNPVVYSSTEAIPSVDRDGASVWTHLALVGNQDPITKQWSLNLYADAVSIGAFTGVVIQPQFGTFLVIGGNTIDNATMYGSLAQLRYWSIARSLGDIRRTWLTSLSGYEANLLGNWPLSAIEAGGGNGQFVRNTAAITNTDWDAALFSFKQPMATTEDSFFLSVVATVAGLPTVEADALLANGRWNHLAVRFEAGGALDMNPPARFASGRPDWVNCGHADSLGPASAFAIDAYLQVPTNSAGEVGAILGRWAADDDTDDQSYLFGVDADGEMNFSIAVVVDDQGTVEIETAKSSRAALKDGLVHHLAVVFSSRRIPGEDPSAEWFITFYKDGAEVGQTSDTIDGVSSIEVRAGQNDVTLGCAYGPIEGAEGMIDEDYDYLHARIGAVRFWTTNAAVSTLFPEKYPRIPQAGTPKGLAAQWLFREQTGRTAFDGVGGNDATLSNSAMWSSLAATSKMSFVANGALVGAVGPATAALAAVAQSQFTMGAPTGGALIPGLIGDIAQVCLYDQARSTETIQDQMYVPRQGNEAGLIACWNFSSGGLDITGGQNNPVPPVPASKLSPSTAPMSDEGPYVRDVYGGLINDLSQSAPGPIVVGSYADAQDVGSVRQRGVLKRQYVVNPNDTLMRAIQIGELDLTYIGQVQTDPTLIGYIEGAPPVPSENLTRPYFVDPANPSYTKYGDTSKVTLKQEVGETLTFTSSSAHATQIEASAAIGLVGVRNYAGVNVGLGFSLSTNTFDAKTVAQAVFKGSGSVGGGEGENLTASYGAIQTDAMAFSGDWEAFQSDPKRYLNPMLGRCYVPDNMGYALVESLTADLYAITFGPTKAALGTIILPNPAIPPDRNILLFPMRNDYTKAGTLDGKIGLMNDPSFPMADAVRGSYFKPVEAYAMAARINQQRERALGVVNQFDVGARARGWDTSLDDAKASQSQDFSETPGDPIAVATPVQGLVNRYVWTADGGFHSEEQNTAASSTRSYAGAVSRGGGAGFHGEGEFFLKAGFAWSLDVMATHQVDVTVSKESSSSQALSMDVSVEGEGFLRTYDPNAPAEYGSGKGAYLPGATPGKVKVYRFMTIYLPPSARNSVDFNGIVDPVWKRLSNDSNARAMREMDLSSPTWRVLHRVTYVERVPPPLASRPLFTTGKKIMAPVNVEGNAELIRLVCLQLPPLTPERTRLVVGNAVAATMNPAPTAPGVYPISALEQIVPWWGTFLNRARPNSTGTVSDPAAATLLQALVSRTTTYMYEGFAADAFGDIIGA